jgi:hypothetical protein
MRITKKMHAEVLLQMLNNADKLCNRCPGVVADLKYGIEFCHDIKGDNLAKYCRLCTNFVSKRSEMAPWRNYAHTPIPDKCPCYKFGKKEAIKRTWIALEAGGFLD